MGQTLGSIFNPTIAGTGQTAGDLKNIGYSDQDLAMLDPKRAAMNSALKGAASGFGKSTQPNPQGGGGVISAGGAPPATSVDPGYFAPSQFRPLNQNAFYGG